jgi:hypothetical protein
MEVSAELDRTTLLALIDRMVRAEAREDAPPQAERGEWMYGSVEPLAFTEPDAHGWMAIAPSASPKRWIPRALCFWREVVSMGAAVSLEQMTHPAHALARWPGIERAVLAYIAASFPPLALTDSAGESVTRH